MTTYRNVALFLISSMVLGLLDQLQIFWQLYLIGLLGLLTGLESLELLHLIYPRLSTEFDMLVYFTNLGLLDFLVRYLALFLLFSVIDSFVELASELESDIRNTVDWGRSHLLISMLEKLNLFWLTGLKRLALLMWKWMGFLMSKKNVLRWVVFFF